MNTSELLSTSKGKLKWEGDFASLKKLFEEVLDSSTEWTSPGGSSKKCECDGLTLRWYPTTGSLTLNGVNAEKIKTQLLQLMEAGYEEIAELSQNGGQIDDDDEEEAVMHNIEECEVGIDLHNKSMQRNNLGNTNNANFAQTREDVFNKTTRSNADLTVILEHLEHLQNKMDRSFASFNNELRELRATTELSLEIRASRVMSENITLKDENSCLKDKISELHAKLRDIENERNSLLTLVRIVQEQNNNNKHQSNPIVINESSTSPRTPVNNSPSYTSAISVLIGDKTIASKTQDDLENRNVNDGGKQSSEAVQEERVKQSRAGTASVRFDEPENRNVSGGVELSSDAAQKDQSHKYCRNNVPTKEKQVNKQDQSSSNNAPILLMGDSIIKNIDPRKISRRKTVKVCLSGKRAEEIASEVKSIFVTNPSHVILHAGTNNLPRDNVRECTKHVEGLVKSVKERFPDAKIALSAITLRRDIDLHGKIIEVNGKLQDLCNKHGLDFIDNNNLNETCLNGSQLHLNPKGSAYLATNFIRFLRGNNIQSSKPSRRDVDFRISAPRQLHLLEDLLRLMSTPQTRKTRGRTY